MTDFRALCAELVDELEEWLAFGDVDAIELAHALIDQARSALAQSEPQVVTDEELLETAAEAVGYEHVPPDETCLLLARAALARWGRPTIKPVPVSERLPGLEDCDAEGRCWCYGEGGDMFGWTIENYSGFLYYRATHWLPYHALPVPQQEAE